MGKKTFTLKYGTVLAGIIFFRFMLFSFSSFPLGLKVRAGGFYDGLSFLAIMTSWGTLSSEHYDGYATHDC